MIDEPHNIVKFKGLIVLIGYMGCGKSTVGRLLAKHFDLPFIDLDHHIETELGSSVPEIFNQKGAIYFRKEEHRCLTKILNSEGSFVLSLGGGAPCYHDNMEIIKKATPHTFYLAPSVAELSTRLFDKRSKRPLIAHIVSKEEMSEFIAKHIFERSPYYEQATHVLRVDANDPKEMVAAIIKKLG